MATVLTLGGYNLSNLLKDGRPEGTQVGRTVTSAPSPVQPNPSIPSSAVGVPVRGIIGKYRVNDPNLIWFGNIEAIYESVTEESVDIENIGWGIGNQEVITSVTTTYVVGYVVDLALAVCLGPGAQLTKIFYDDVAVWNGAIGPNRTQITLPYIEGSPFSGSKLTWHGGAYDQAPDEIITEPDNPGYVGVAYCIIEGVRTDLQFGTLSFEVSRYPNPLGLSTANNKIGDDINAVSALAELITNPWGFAGVDISNIDIDNFRAAATQSRNEGNTLSLFTAANSDTKAMISIIQQQLFSFIYQDVITSKVKIKLIRPTTGGGNIEAVFGYNNILELREYTKSRKSDLLGQLSATYTDRNNNYSNDTLLGQVPSYSSAERKRSKTASIDYSFVTRKDLANNLLKRDLSNAARPRFKATLVTNSDGADLVPGSVVSVNLYDFEIYSTLAYVDKIRVGPTTDNGTLVYLTQLNPPDIAGFTLPSDPVEADYTFGPVQPLAVWAQSLPYWIARKLGAQSSNTQTKAGAVFLAIPGNQRQLSFNAYWYDDSGFLRPDPYKQVASNLGYEIYCQLATHIDKYDGWGNGLIPSVDIDSVVGGPKLFSPGAEGVIRGQFFLIIGNEYFSFENVTQLGPNSYRLTNVRRALLDTVASEHLIGSHAFIINGTPSNALLIQPGNLVNGLPKQWRFSPNTINFNGKFENAVVRDVPSLWEPTYLRTYAPPRPHGTAIDGIRSVTPVALTEGATAAVTWRTRARTTIDVKRQNDPADDPEQTGASTFQRHRVFIVDAANNLYDCGVTLDDGAYNSLNIIVPNVSDPGDGWLFVQAEITVSLYDSLLRTYSTVTIPSYFQDRVPITLTNL